MGDIYCVTLDDSKVYLQYVAKDETQLYSPVVRVFKKRYAPNEVVDLEDVVCCELFYMKNIGKRLAAVKILEIRKIGLMNTYPHGCF